MAETDPKSVQDLTNVVSIQLAEAIQLAQAIQLAEHLHPSSRFRV